MREAVRRSSFPYRASAAWGASDQGKTSWGDTHFAKLLRFVGHDMGVSDYLDTGTLNYQIPPTWFVDNG